MNTNSNIKSNNCRLSVIETSSTSLGECIEELNKCDWCLAYGDNIETTKKYFKRNMLQNGKSIHINVCSNCEDKLKEILED